MSPLVWVVSLIFPACGGEGAAGLPVPVPMDMTRIERPATPNTFLAGPVGMQPVPDLIVADQPMPPDALFAAARAAFGGQERAFVAADFPALRQIHYVVRSKLLNYPDLVTVQVTEAGADKSALTIWSRSIYGRKDFGVNQERTERWLATLQQANRK